jgi:NAD-dependent SIR2 family protein deacetylase
MQNELKLNINPNDLQDVECENCQCKFFNHSFMIKKLSAFQSPTGKAMMMPLQVFRCDNCGEVMNPEV